MQAAAEELARLECLPFAAFVSDPCDGRTQGTTGMMDSLAYRNDAALVFRRLIRSLPTRRGVLGIATCDKGLPAMMLALVAMRDLPCVLVPGGVTLPPQEGEDAGKVQSIGARFAHGELSLERAQELGCRACGSPGGGCQFLGTAATSQVVGEALGLSLPHSALAPSGQPIWLDGARRSARALVNLDARGIPTREIVTDGGGAQRHGRARRVRRLDQPSPPRARHRPCGRTPAALHRRLDRSQPRRAAPRRCHSQRAASDGARLPRRGCPRGDAALAAGWSPG